jgi:hypothetical protein
MHTWQQQLRVTLALSWFQGLRHHFHGVLLVSSEPLILVRELGMMPSTFASEVLLYVPQQSYLFTNVTLFWPLCSFFSITTGHSNHSADTMRVAGVSAFAFQVGRETE